MKKSVRKLRLTRETLRLLEEVSQERLKEVNGGYPVTTVKGYPCQASCRC